MLRKTKKSNKKQKNVAPTRKPTKIAQKNVAPTRKPTKSFTRPSRYAAGKNKCFEPTYKLPKDEEDFFN